MDVKYKAEVVRNTGWTIVKKEYVEEVMKELENDFGNYSTGTEMNGLVVIERIG